MKLRVFLGSLVWAVLITVAHVHVNVGWSSFWHHVKVFLGQERAELIVGFLPVT